MSDIQVDMSSQVKIPWWSMCSARYRGGRGSIVTRIVALDMYGRRRGFHSIWALAFVYSSALSPADLSSCFEAESPFTGFSGPFLSAVDAGTSVLDTVLAFAIGSGS